MPNRRAFLIHGWTGRHDQDWFPWAIDALQQRGYTAIAPAMPNPDHPVMSEWLAAMEQTIGALEPTDVLIGHSLGCQMILRYLERRNEKVDAVILIAGWDVLSDAALPEPEDHEIVKPLYETPIDYPKVRQLANRFVAFFSEDDPWVPVEPNRTTYREKLGATIIVDQSKGHYMETVGGVTEIPEIFTYLKS